MSLTTQVLIALGAGFALGIPLAGSESAFATGLLAVLGPVGTVFINAIRMTVIPLVVSSLIVGVTSAPEPRAVGRIGARALVFFVVAVALAAAAGILIGGPLLAMIPLDPAGVAALQAAASGGASAATEGARSIPTAAEWLVSLVPSNPVKAAADGAMLPLIVASVAFAIALMQVAPERRSAVVRVVEGVMDASLALVRAILTLAPIGVFALAVPLAARMGAGALGAILGYIVIVSGICVLFWFVVFYPAAVVFGKVPFRAFARATLPAQSIAFSSRSSLAALPALLESVRDTLRLPPAIGSFLIPLAATMFRAGAGIGQTVGVLFLARLYGVDLDAAQLLTIAVTSTVTSFSVPGVPGGSIIIMVPVLMAAGIPVEGIGILLGADTIPDMFRTTTNVTGHMTAAVILARGERAPA
jgi:Na+/H+-dicarboxylate symporter